MKSRELLRMYFDFVYLYKIIHCLIDSPELSLVSFNIKFRANNSNETNKFA